MLRNNTKYTQKLLQQNKYSAVRQFQTNLQQCAKSEGSGLGRQAKIMNKLFGDRAAGSKKHWYPMHDPNATQRVTFDASQFGKSTRTHGGGKNSTRRMHVLNKLFMKHITDLLATGEASEAVLGRGLMVTRVKTSPDFAYVNVYWYGSGEVLADQQLEKELQRCSGILRHDLSQLELVGEVPRIHFVRERTHSNLQQVEALLKNMDFSEENDEEKCENECHHPNGSITYLKNEFFGKRSLKTIPQTTTTTDAQVYQFPEMRHDVLGLDHSGIMLKILTKMRKSKQAWDLHNQNINNATTNNCILPVQEKSAKKLDQINKKLEEAVKASEEFDKYLMKRRERKNIPERKKYYKSNDLFDDTLNAQFADDTTALSKQQKHLYYEEDFIYEENESETKKA